jgi:hypothetical protein
MHPVTTLVAFALAALVTFALVLAGLSAASALSQERRTDAPDPGDDPAPPPDRGVGTPLPPWVPAGYDRTARTGEPAEYLALERSPRAHH